MKEVTVYIPCFNAQATVSLCIEAVLKQRYPFREIIVVDDGSTDRTMQIASRYPVRIISLASNSGLAAARNAAITQIGTEFIASFDSDCVPAYDWLENAMEGFSSSAVAAVGGKLLEVQQTTVFDFWRAVHMKQYWDDDQRNPAFLFGSNTVFRREGLTKIGLYNTDLGNNYEDVDICERLRSSGYLIYYEPNAQAYHLKQDNLFSLLNTFWSWHRAYYKKIGFYQSDQSVVSKVKDNIGLVNRYIDDDLCEGRDQLVFLDFLMLFHHCLKDFEYFILKKTAQRLPYSALDHCLSIIDLTFFYHFDRQDLKKRTFLPASSFFLLNVSAFLLLLDEIVRTKFKAPGFAGLLRRLLLSSLFNQGEPYVSAMLTGLCENRPDWKGLLNRSHPLLHVLFLESLAGHLQHWLNTCGQKIKKIEYSGKQFLNGGEFLSGGS